MLTRFGFIDFILSGPTDYRIYLAAGQRRFLPLNTRGRHIINDLTCVHEPLLTAAKPPLLKKRRSTEPFAIAGQDAGFGCASRVRIRGVHRDGHIKVKKGS